MAGKRVHRDTSKSGLDSSLIRTGAATPGRWRAKLPWYQEKLRKRCLSLAMALLFVACWHCEAKAGYAPQGLHTSKHNLSVSGPGPVKATSETQECIFCHTPHSAKPAVPLWNHDPIQAATYALYTSTTMKSTTVGQPTGSSRLCLSCHDGSIAIGAIGSRQADVEMTDRGAQITTIPADHLSNLSTDLSDDHPVSFNYDSALYSASNGQLADPSTLTGAVRLSSGRLECTSCHDPHTDAFGKFLVMSNSKSRLCIACHRTDYLVTKPDPNTITIHMTSTKTWNGLGRNPWPHTAYLVQPPNPQENLTVAVNGCENCHRPHTANGKRRLLNYLTEEYTCLVCHDGNIDSKNIAAEFAKSYKHSFSTTTEAHDPKEIIRAVRRHAECVDCHNPHAAQPGNHVEGTGGNAASPALKGVWGVAASYSTPPAPSAGTEALSAPSYTAVKPVTKEYQLCLKCHSSYAYTGSPPSGYTDQGKESNPNNFSSHPVVLPGDNPYCNKNTMNSPWNQGFNEHDTMYCSDCHTSDDSSSPKGPHGSNNKYLLRAIGPGAGYDDLCLICHKSSVYIDGNGGSSFDGHVTDKHRLSSGNNPLGCMACHAGYVGNFNGRHGNIHGSNYKWANNGGFTGMPSVNLIVGGYVSGFVDNGRNQFTCYADPAAASPPAGQCHPGGQTYSRR